MSGWEGWEVGYGIKVVQKRASLLRLCNIPSIFHQHQGPIIKNYLINPLGKRITPRTPLKISFSPFSSAKGS